MKARPFFCALICTLFLFSFAPNIFPQNNREKVFTDYAEAIKNPASVYALKIRDFKGSFNECPLDAFTELQSLSIEYCGFSQLPKGLSKLTKLQELYVMGTPIAALPEDMGRLARLEVLHLYDTRLSALPESFSGLKNLKKLNLSANSLLKTGALEDVFLLENLEELSLCNLGIERMSPSIGRLVKLRKLELYNNRLQTLPTEIGNLRLLQEFILGEERGTENFVSNLPGSFAQLAALRRLDLSHCRLEAIPGAVFHLPNLEYLNLSNNQLRTLNPEIGLLTNIKSLKIQNNRIKNIPEELGNMKALEEFVFYSNMLSVSEQVQAVWMVRKKHFSSDDVATIEKNFKKVENVVLTHQDPPLAVPHDYSVMFRQDSVFYQPAGKKPALAQTIDQETFESIQKAAYMLLFLRSKIGLFIDLKECTGSSKNTVLIGCNGSETKISLKSCAEPPFKEEFDLVVGLLEKYANKD